MILSSKTERALMKHDELELLTRTHHPAILELEDGALSDAQQRIRTMRVKERTLVRDMRRSIRGKAKARGASFPGEVDRPSRRKQVWANALKRINGELARRHAIAAREALRESAHRAYALKNAADGRDARSPGRTSREGMAPIESKKRRTSVNRAKVGSVSQRTKNAQAAKDARGSR